MMQKLHIKIGHKLTFIPKLQLLIVGYLTDNSRLDILRRKQLADRLEFFRHNRDDHSFLRFADPHLSISKSRIFKRYLFQVNLAPEFLRHLANLTAKPTCTAIADSLIKTRIPCLQKCIQCLLFHDRITDLHRMRKNIFMLMRHLSARERRAVNAVPSRLSADNHQQIPRLRMRKTLITRYQPDIAAEHKRIGHIPLVEIDRPVNSRDTHPVSIITHPADNTFHNALRMQNALRNILKLRIGRRKTEHIGIRDGFGTEPRSHRVTDNPADTGRRTAVRVQRRRMIMRFDLKANRGIVGIFDDPRIVDKNRNAPVLVKILRSLKNRFF